MSKIKKGDWFVHKTNGYLYYVRSVNLRLKGILVSVTNYKGIRGGIFEKDLNRKFIKTDKPDLLEILYGY